MNSLSSLSLMSLRVGAQMVETEAPLTRVSQIAGQQMMLVMTLAQLMTAVHLTQAAVRPMMEPPMVEPQTVEQLTMVRPMTEARTTVLQMMGLATEEKAQVE